MLEEAFVKDLEAEDPLLVGLEADADGGWLTVVRNGHGGVSQHSHLHFVRAVIHDVVVCVKGVYEVRVEGVLGSVPWHAEVFPPVGNCVVLGFGDGELDILVEFQGVDRRFLAVLVHPHGLRAAAKVCEDTGSVRREVHFDARHEPSEECNDGSQHPVRWEVLESLAVLVPDEDVVELDVCPLEFSLQHGLRYPLLAVEVLAALFLVVRLGVADADQDLADEDVTFDGDGCSDRRWLIRAEILVSDAESPVDVGHHADCLVAPF
mmetsp:Transcript_1726/g.4759  ORF Transcript_1726/g.4759 Transcript_1726/m.4759 type:complete len:264 (-) Transcript_1726:259-1050(-)